MAEIITARTSGVAPHIPVVEELNVTQNGTYTATSGVDGYSPVNVNVQPVLITKNITANGTYNASSDNADHIVEEGGQLTRAQLRNIQKGGEASPSADEVSENEMR